MASMVTVQKHGILYSAVEKSGFLCEICFEIDSRQEPQVPIDCDLQKDIAFAHVKLDLAVCGIAD
jgi:hypothetical protein